MKSTGRRKRVLLISLHYAPEATGNGPYAAGLARGLAVNLDVDVVSAHPHYPEWRVADGYGGWRTNRVADGVQVARLKHYLPRSPTGPSRIVSEATFALRALAPGVTRPDVVLVMTPALAPAASAVMLGRRWGVPVGVIVQDLYSKAFSELGLLGGRADRPVHVFERSVLRRAQGIVAIHSRMADVIARDYRVPPGRVTVIPNWTHVQAPTGDRSARRRELGWDDGRLVVVHAGNMGTKQGLEHLIPAARLIDQRSMPVRLVLIGNGGMRKELEERASGLRSLEFMDALPDHSFMNTLAAADVLLLHERPGMREMCMPSKLTSYFAASRPVLGVTEFESAAASEILGSGAGIVARPGDPEAVLDGLRTLKLSDLDELGRLGLTHAERTLNEDIALDKYRSWVSSLLTVRRPSRVNQSRPKRSRV